jgi:hypothetical protein
VGSSLNTKGTKVFGLWQRQSGKAKGLLAVKAQITLPAKANFGCVNVVIKRFVGKRDMLIIWWTYATTVGTILKF